MFATGIENSIPTINNGKTRVDEMEVCGHYQRWREDFDCVQEIGINFLRYGPPIHKTYLGPGKYDWEFADLTFADLKRRDITPIVDLCHFGVPDWIGNFQNPDFPQLFAQYAAAFAERYPWVQLYTPVNEMFICAIFSAKYGWWNEQMTNDRAFVTALKHIVKANVLAMLEILKHRADAIFIQSESSEYFHADSPGGDPSGGAAELPPFPQPRPQLRPPGRQRDVRISDGQRDDEGRISLLPSQPAEAALHPGQRLLPDQRASRVRGRRTRPHRARCSATPRSRGNITTATGLPVMHTETNLIEGPVGDEAVHWLWKEWANVLRLRNVGIPTVGFTWYSLTDQIDWDTALREQNGNVNALGLFDLDRNIRNVGRAYNG